jgi:hypothetical protein
MSFALASAATSTDRYTATPRSSLRATWSSPTASPCLWRVRFTGRPVILLERKGHVPFNEADEVVLGAFHRVSTGDGGSRARRAASPPRDPLRDVQREVVHKLFGKPGAAGRILAMLRTQALAEGWQPGRPVTTRGRRASDYLPS